MVGGARCRREWSAITTLRVSAARVAERLDAAVGSGSLGDRPRRCWNSARSSLVGASAPCGAAGALRVVPLQRAIIARSGRLSLGRLSLDLTGRRDRCSATGHSTVRFAALADDPGGNGPSGHVLASTRRGAVVATPGARLQWPASGSSPRTGLDHGVVPCTFDRPACGA